MVPPYYLYISYPTVELPIEIDLEVDNAIENITKKYGGEDIGGGSGFGFRDLEYEFTTRRGAEKAKVEVEKFFPKADVSDPIKE